MVKAQRVTPKFEVNTTSILPIRTAASSLTLTRDTIQVLEILLRLVCDLGGLFVFLYILFSAVNSVLTWRQFDNDLVSELYQEPSRTDYDFDEKKEGFETTTVEGAKNGNDAAK